MLSLSIGMFMTLFIVYLIKRHLHGSKRKDLEGKHIVITGGSSGIGKEVALQAAELGAHVTVISRNVGNLEKTVSEVIKCCKDRQKQKVQYVSLDVTKDYSTIEREFTALEENVGPIYMLVNSAGRSICGRMEDLSAEDIKLMVDLNYFGSAYPTKAILGSMKSRDEGIIVLVSSMAALTGIFGMGPYSGGKWAVRGLGECLQTEVVNTGVSVTLCYPPDTDTPGFEIEEITKPLETKLISKSGGLARPKDIAKKLLDDSLACKHTSLFGFENHLLGYLCITAYNGFLPALFQALIMGPMRLVFVIFQMQFQSIVLKCRREKNTNKKAE